MKDYDLFCGYLFIKIILHFDAKENAFSDPRLNPFAESRIRNFRVWVFGKMFAASSVAGLTRVRTVSLNVTINN